ncbi:FitA-like ribbon-helix-helix domain-containing protein [Neoroseomonas rubea]|nr:hypothetical protein [Roseomonas rubea]
MAGVTVRNLSEEVHRALNRRAMRPEGRVRLGVLLVELGRAVALTR